MLSIEELGYTSIALGSTSMIEHLVPELQENQIKVTQPFVIALDNDKAGQAAAEKLLTLLQESNYEALTNDKKFFEKKIV